jgi:hypothetical protein
MKPQFDYAAFMAAEYRLRHGWTSRQGFSNLAFSSVAIATGMSMRSRTSLARRLERAAGAGSSSFIGYRSEGFAVRDRRAGTSDRLGQVQP